jgi:hypothetical protein
MQVRPKWEMKYYHEFIYFAAPLRAKNSRGWVKKCNPLENTKYACDSWGSQVNNWLSYWSCGKWAALAQVEKRVLQLNWLPQWPAPCARVRQSGPLSKCRCSPNVQPLLKFASRAFANLPNKFSLVLKASHSITHRLLTTSERKTCSDFSLNHF